MDPLEFLPLIADFFQNPTSRAFIALTAVLTILILNKLFGKRIVAWFKRKVGNRKKARTFHQLLGLESYILEKIKRRIGYLHCDRVFIFEFHNGSHTVRNGDILKMSCTYEVVRHIRKDDEDKFGIDKYYQSKYNSIPTSQIPFFLNKALLDTPFYCEDVEELKGRTHRAYKELKERNVNSFIIAPLKDSYGNSLGFMLCEYYMLRMRKTEELVEEVNNLSRQLSTLLSDPESYREDYLEEFPQRCGILGKK